MANAFRFLARLAFGTHFYEKCFERLRGLVGEGIGEPKLLHAIESKTTEIVAKFAPCCERPNFSPEVEAEGANTSR